MIRLARSKVSIFGGAHADAAHVALLIAEHDPVADLDRALDQQDQPGHEVVDDRLQAEADAHRQRAGDDGQIGDVEAGVGDGEQGWRARCRRSPPPCRWNWRCPGSMRVCCSACSRSQRWNSRRGEQQRDEQRRCRAGCGRARCGTGRSRCPKNSDLNQSRMSAPEKPHCSIRNGRARDDEGEGERELGQARQLVAARRVEAEAGSRASRRPDSRRCCGSRVIGADGEIAAGTRRRRRCRSAPAAGR